MLYYSKSILSRVGINDVLDLTVVHYREFTIVSGVVKKNWSWEYILLELSLKSGGQS